MKHNTLKALVLSAVLLTSSALCTALPQPVQAAQEESIVHVMGYAEQQVTPDTALITVGVETTADTAATARTQNNAVMQGVSSSLQDMGITKAQLQTTNFSLHPNYEPNNTRKIKSYTVSNALRIKVSDFALIPQIIAKSEAAGANQMYGVRFMSEHTDAIRASLIRQAIQNGKKEAAEAASAAGAILGNVKEINITGRSPSYGENSSYLSMRAMKMDSTPIEAGTNTISESVDMTFYLH